ncbi:Glyco_trans_2-like domain-containing protein [Durusdinium trenchii]|uniref:Glyco_trans_2-like domain-containing protein n=1 Tax=Durusdinium trenchii TaxID=1381693 RepID=A0ABP0H5H0_9DINO
MAATGNICSFEFAPFEVKQLEDTFQRLEQEALTGKEHRQKWEEERLKLREEVLEVKGDKLQMKEALVVLREELIELKSSLKPQNKQEECQAPSVQKSAALTTVTSEDEDSDADSGSMVTDCSNDSWIFVTSDPCCVVPETCFEVICQDFGKAFVPARSLFQGAKVVAANGRDVVEVLHPPEQHQIPSVIELRAGNTCLVVSPDHRISVPGSKTVKAEDLRRGSKVILKETETTLTHVERKNEPTIVLKLAFKPDHPVAGFTPQDAILSKGSRDRPPVRRGLKRKKALPKAHSGHIMPDAENRQTSQAEEDEAVPDDGHGHASYASDGRTVPVDCQSSGSLRTDDSLTLK